MRNIEKGGQGDTKNVTDTPLRRWRRGGYIKLYINIYTYIHTYDRRSQVSRVGDPPKEARPGAISQFDTIIFLGKENQYSKPAVLAKSDKRRTPKRESKTIHDQGD